MASYPLRAIVRHVDHYGSAKPYMLGTPEDFAGATKGEHNGTDDA